MIKWDTKQWYYDRMGYKALAVLGNSLLYLRIVSWEGYNGKQINDRNKELDTKQLPV